VRFCFSCNKKYTDLPKSPYSQQHLQKNSYDYAYNVNKSVFHSYTNWTDKTVDSSLYYKIIIVLCVMT
jgi:hypothetical protein